jgi:drug/metabolite transporter (DMT)-like permease
MAEEHIGPAEWAVFFLCVALWGSAYAMVEVALAQGAEPAVIVASRLWMGTALLHAFWYWRRRQGAMGPRTPGVQAKLFGLGLFGATLPFSLLSWGQQHIDSSLAGILAAITPLIVAAIAPLLGQDKRLTAARGIGLGLGFAGVVTLMGPAALGGLGGGGSMALLGQAAAAGAALSYAVNGLLARAGKSVPTIEASAGWTLYGALLATPLAVSAALAGGLPAISGWWAIVGLAIGPTALASVGYFWLVRRTGPTFITQTNYAIPLWAVGLGALALGERIGPQAFAALGLIGLGLFVAQDGVGRALSWARRHGRR